jgi:hypothetical protein
MRARVASTSFSETCGATARKGVLFVLPASGGDQRRTRRLTGKLAGRHRRRR